MIRTDSCPDCGGEFVREASWHSEVTLRVGDDERVTHDSAWTVACANGHAWSLESTCNVSPYYTLTGRSAKEAVDASED